MACSCRERYEREKEARAAYERLQKEREEKLMRDRKAMEEERKRAREHRAARMKRDKANRAQAARDKKAKKGGAKKATQKAEEKADGLSGSSDGTTGLEGGEAPRGWKDRNLPFAMLECDHPLALALRAGLDDRVREIIMFSVCPCPNCKVDEEDNTVLHYAVRDAFGAFAECQ